MDAHSGLVVRTQQPLNAETPLGLLVRSFVTPAELFFVRTHGPVPEVDRRAYRLAVGGLVRDALELSLDDLRRFARTEVTAVLQCAGNRRSELAAVRPLPGEVPWDAGALGNGVWGGVRLRDVLAAAGLGAEQGHVAFAGLDGVAEDGVQTRFGGSVPLETALQAEVLLADQLNGEPLAPVHGAPLRVVVPGMIGARSVKWLSSVTVQAQPSANHFQTAYSLRPSDGSGEPGITLGEFPVSAVTCWAGQGTARGYALTGGRRLVERVDVSVDGGESWARAELLDDALPGSWRRWHAVLEPAPAGSELVVRAWDSAASTQPEHAASCWNPKGYLNTAWHRTPLT